MEENVRIVITGNNRDALSKLNKVEQAVNRLNSAANKVEVKVTGLQEAERQAARLYQALERVENAALSKLPQSLQTVIAYLKAANAGLGEFTKRAITAAAAVGDIGRVPFAPIIKAQSQAIKQFKEMERGLVSLRVEFVRVFDKGSTQPLLDGLNLVRVSVLETKGLLEGRGDFTRPMLDGLDLVKVRILEIKRLLGGLGGGGGGGRIPPAVPPNAPRLPQGAPVPIKTIDSLERLRNKLEEIYRTTEIGTPRFKELEENIAALTQEIQDAQLRFQKATTTAVPGSLSALRAEIAAKEASLNQTKRGTREFNQLADELRNLNRELSKAENFIEGRTKGSAGRVGTALQSAALGGGFPLLFGGPSFSAAGGAAGGFAGGLIGQGAGFAGGIVGSAAGAAIDSFVQKALELGRALRNPTDNLDALVESLGTLGSAANGLITELKALGANEIAAALATEQLSAKLASYGIDSEAFVNETTKFDNALKDLQLAFAAFGVKFIPLINFLTKTLNNFVGPGGQGRSGPEAVQGAAAASNTVQAVEQARNKILRDNLNVQKQLTANKQKDLELTDSQRATLESNLKLQQNQAELDKLMLRAAFEQNAAKKRILINEVLITKEKRKQLIADQEAASARSVQQRVTNLLQEGIKQRGFQAQAAQLSATFAQQNLSPLEAITQRAQAVEKLRATEVARVRDLMTITRDEIGLEEKLRQEKLNTLELEEQLINRRAAAQQQELQNLENVLRVQREIDTIRVSTGQRLQLAESKDALERSQIQLQNPLGGGEKDLQRLNQIKELRDLQISQDAQLLSLQEKLANARGADIALVANQIVTQMQVNDAVKEEALARQEVERAILNQELALERVQPVVEAVTTGVFDMFSAILDGSKSAEEAFSDFLKGIAQLLLKTAAQMIATYIAIGVARMFAGVPADGGDSSDSFAGIPNSVLDSIIGAKANGGPVASGNPYIVGERGPELFVPRSNGRIVPNGRFGGGGGGDTNVVVNVDAKGSSTQGNEPNAKALGAAIGAAVQSEIIKQKRPGGLLA